MGVALVDLDGIDLEDAHLVTRSRLPPVLLDALDRDPRVAKDRPGWESFISGNDQHLAEGALPRAAR